MSQRPTRPTHQDVHNVARVMYKMMAIKAAHGKLFRRPMVRPPTIAQVSRPPAPKRVKMPPVLTRTMVVEFWWEMW